MQFRETHVDAFAIVIVFPEVQNNVVSAPVCGDVVSDFWKSGSRAFSFLASPAKIEPTTAFPTWNDTAIEIEMLG